MEKEHIIPILIIGFILIVLNSVGFFEQLFQSAVNVKDILENTAPTTADSLRDTTSKLIPVGQTYCNAPDLVLESIQPYMLENVNNETRDVLTKLKDGGQITSCEIKILDDNLTPIYKSNLNFKSINPKLLGCNLLDCIEKYDLVPPP